MALLCLPAWAGDGTVKRHEKKVPDQYILQFEDSVAGSEELAGELVTIHGGRSERVFMNTIKGMVFTGSLRQAEALSRDPRVKLVAEVAIGSVQGAPPQDPPTGKGWGRDRINEHALPLDNVSTFTGSIGTGMLIYVVDTGITDYTGTEFGTRLRNVWKAKSSWDYKDAYGHGTMVASIAAGSTLGVLPNAKIGNVRVADVSGTVDSATLLSAIGAVNADFATFNPPGVYTTPAVVNMSLKFPGDDILDNAVRDSIRRGLAYVVAAGNGKRNSDGTWSREDASNFSPARLGRPNTTVNPYPEHTLTVGATSLTAPWDRDEVAYYPAEFVSNIGAPIEIWAPGYRVHGVTKSGAVVPVHGTSMATAYVSAALVRYGSASEPGGAGIQDRWELKLLNVTSNGMIWDPGTNSFNPGGASNALVWLWGSPNNQ